MPTLLVVHHTTSPALQELLDAVLDGTKADGIDGVDVRVRPALTASVVDALEADGYLLGTPANIGYLSGALKHFFDQIYYPVLSDKPGAPYGLWVHGAGSSGGSGGLEGAVRAGESIAKGLGWQAAHAPVTVLGAPSKADREACWDLGATVAATLAGLT